MSLITPKRTKKVKTAQRDDELEMLQALFSPTERAILFDYFEIARPKALAEIDIHEQPSYGGLWVNKVLADTGRGVEAVVAQIALSKIQNSLPQCGIVHNGDVTLTRHPFVSSLQTAFLFPQHLFTINWADSGPGMSWPEAYHVTYFPGFERQVVTASMDSPDMWGVTEMAIGSFTVDTPLQDGCCGVLCDWWGGQRNMEQAKWAYVWDEGLIKNRIANEWADSVWDVDIEEEELNYE